LTLVN